MRFDVGVLLREFLRRLLDRYGDLASWSGDVHGSIRVEAEAGFRDIAIHRFVEALDDELDEDVLERACQVLRLTREDRRHMGLPPPRW